MTVLLGAGTIRIDVTVSRALACSVTVKANRPQGLTRMFVGRRPEEAPPLAGQVFSLCGFAQSVAARLAVLNAADMAMKEDERIGSGAGLLAERIFETLRALILHWPSPVPASLGATAGRHLREALAASQEIIAAPRPGKSTGRIWRPPLRGCLRRPARSASRARATHLCRNQPAPRCCRI
ncbi:hypothetical protein [Mesorhizobium huakuii]|uniref:hypothetical protein n=1 Tax=Mesorhizobium huakuii TaxID=28104 RepID=UPI001FD3D90D|nr:hypothetical protein [Mesorhizobium huakuii]